MGGIDFYDVDHTLLRGTSGVRFLLMGVRRRLFPALAAFYIPLILFRYRLGLLGGSFGTRVFRGLRGRNRDALASLARESYLAVRRRIYPGARELVAQRKASGRRAVLATSSIDVIVRPLAEELGVEEVLAVSLEIAGDCYTGRFLGPPLFGHWKMDAVLSYIRSHDLRPESCAFFSDSITDLPLLQAVGEPVAVNPDRRLRALARRRGWPILRFSRNRRHLSREGSEPD